MWIQFLLLKFSTQFLYFLTSLQNFVSKLFAKYFFPIFPQSFSFLFSIFFYKFGHMRFQYLNVRPNTCTAHCTQSSRWYARPVPIPIYASKRFTNIQPFGLYWSSDIHSSCLTLYSHNGLTSFLFGHPVCLASRTKRRLTLMRRLNPTFPFSLLPNST